MTGHDERSEAAAGGDQPGEAERAVSAAGRQEHRSEATSETPEVAETYRTSLYRSRGATSRDAGRFTALVDEAERFWSKVDRTTPGDCWMWLGQTNRWGYGHFRRTLAPGTHRTVKAHRFAYTLLVGPIPEGLTLDHLCGRRACVRPDHLEPVTNAENLRRRHAQRRTEGITP